MLTDADAKIRGSATRQPIESGLNILELIVAVVERTDGLEEGGRWGGR